MILRISVLFIGFSTIIIVGWIELCCLLNVPINFGSIQYKYQFNLISLILSKRIDVEKLSLIMFISNFKFISISHLTLFMIKKLCVKCYYINSCSLSLYQMLVLILQVRKLLMFHMCSIYYICWKETKYIRRRQTLWRAHNSLFSKTDFHGTLS